MDDFARAMYVGDVIAQLLGALSHTVARDQHIVLGSTTPWYTSGYRKCDALTTNGFALHYTVFTDKFRMGQLVFIPSNVVQINTKNVPVRTEFDSLYLRHKLVKSDIAHSLYLDHNAVVAYLAKYTKTTEFLSIFDE